MNKPALAAAIAAKFSLPKTQTTAMVDHLFDELANCLNNEGDRATIHHFGIFSVIRRPGRVIKAPPRAGRKGVLVVPDKLTIKFFPATLQKKRLNPSS